MAGITGKLTEVYDAVKLGVYAVFEILFLKNRSHRNLNPSTVL